MPRPLFIAATRQHVGKTTVSLAIISGLQKRFGKVGFIKPVGQQHIGVKNACGEEVRVDKDVQLMREYFTLDHMLYEDMSPVLVPRDYTKKFINGEITSAQQITRIENAYGSVSGSSDITLMEGTGHVGVGSIIDLSNANVCKIVGADCLLVANGGIGKAFDELEVNRAVLEQYGVRVRGVILNKVVPGKVDMIRDYFGRACMKRWGVPLLGVVPDLPFLSKSTLGDIERLLGAELIGGHTLRSLHYGADDVVAVTTGLRRYLRKTQHRQQNEGERRPLFVTHCTRDDIVLGYLAHFQKNKHEIDVRRAAFGRGARVGSMWLGSMVLCQGENEGVSEDDNHALPYLMDIVKAYDAPIMVAPAGTVDVADNIAAFTAKLNIGDRSRVAAAIAHYEPHIDFDVLLNDVVS